MNRNRMMIAVAVAILVAVIASDFVYQQFKHATAVKPVKAEQVVVAAMPLPLGTRLQGQYVRLVSWPTSDRLPGMLTRVEDCADRALITSVVENEPILDRKLAPKEAGAGLAATIPEGMRALSVKVDEVVDVAGFVLPGTIVDVLVTGEVQGGQNGNSITRTILEDVRVLAAGQKVEQDKDGKPYTVPVITLLVTPEQANKLTMASTEGKIHLALRNTIDSKMVDPPPVYRASLFGGEARVKPKQKGAAPAVHPIIPPPTFVVEVIRGDKRETTTFAVR